ncbi:FtsX-like permease family protein [Nonomuraea soli]|uniref:Putative ABC transport system permease protein n=1 Tax=Nonomuraea soli TaxID=1032476 RepID=A0A7W0CHG2_9ACTN|nr:FtsX-like permease family protein [Nonomuraea soli]MBA2891196.1 putative ABC transport system permease protein [Nonomuraea soli]
MNAEGLPALGRVLLLGRLAVRDLRRRPAEAALLLVAMGTATATLTIALVLQGVTAQPYAATRRATAGPDAVASVAQPRSPALDALLKDPAVAARGGPFPYTQLRLTAGGTTVPAWVQGRDTPQAQVERPLVTQGRWARPGGAVLESGFAQALGVRVGGQVTLAGRAFTVSGIALSASVDPYPKTCFAPCRYGQALEQARLGPPPIDEVEPAFTPLPGMGGLVWLTEDDLWQVAGGRQAVGQVTYLRLADPSAALALASAHVGVGASELSVVTSQDILYGHARVAEWKQNAMFVAGWLLGMIALASIAVLAGGRMADQMRRVGLLKAVGGTPALVAAVLLAEHVAIGLAAAAAGLLAGRLAAPLLVDPGPGLVAGPAQLPVSPLTVAVVVGAAVVMATLATLVPAVRAARTSTVRALADAPPPPRRSSRLIALSARLPVPLLLGLRLAARRPRRALLGMAAVAVTVGGIVAVLSTQAHRLAEKAPGDDPRILLNQVLGVVVVLLVVQAAVNAVCIVWATALDVRASAALARALGAGPGQVGAALAAAQVLPALAGALLGVVAGIGLAEALDDDPVSVPPWWQLALVVAGCVVALGALTAIAARMGARRPVGQILGT